MADFQSFDAADPVAENNARADVARFKRADADVLRTIMMGKEGRAWLYRFLDRCHIFGDTFAGEQTHLSAFMQGQENIGRQLWLDVQNASLDLYMKMMKEQKDEEKRVEGVRKKEEEKRRGNQAEPTANMQWPELPPPGSGAPPKE